jgi:phage gp36-like protein
MAYASLAQLTERFGDRMLIALTDRADVALGVVDTSVVDQALADADAVINGFLTGRYKLPLAQTPDLLADLAQTIAIWKLHTSAADPKIETDYKEAMRSLRDISTGAIRLNVAGVEPAGTGGSGVRITDRERPLNADDMKGFI